LNEKLKSAVSGKLYAPSDFVIGMEIGMLDYNPSNSSVLLEDGLGRWKYGNG
jgi:hypothetical protein